MSTAQLQPSVEPKRLPRFGDKTRAAEAAALDNFTPMYETLTAENVDVKILHFGRWRKKPADVLTMYEVVERGQRHPVSYVSPQRTIGYLIQFGLPNTMVFGSLHRLWCEMPLVGEITGSGAREIEDAGLAYQSGAHQFKTRAAALDDLLVMVNGERRADRQREAAEEAAIVAESVVEGGVQFFVEPPLQPVAAQSYNPDRDASECWTKRVDDYVFDGDARGVADRLTQVAASIDETAAKMIAGEINVRTVAAPLAWYAQRGTLTYMGVTFQSSIDYLLHECDVEGHFMLDGEHGDGVAMRKIGGRN